MSLVLQTVQQQQEVFAEEQQLTAKNNNNNNNKTSSSIADSQVSTTDEPCSPRKMAEVEAGARAVVVQVEQKKKGEDVVRQKSPAASQKTPTTTVQEIEYSNKVQQNLKQDPDGFEVFVGRMPLHTTENNLRELAAPFSPTEVRVLSKPDRNCHLCGFVVFQHINKAQGFIAGFNGRVALNGLSPLNVRFADGKARKKVFIGGLSIGTNEENLFALASSCGTILSVKILSKNEKAPCGFVAFASVEGAEKCIAELNNKPNSDSSKKYVVKMAKSPELGAGAKVAAKRKAGPGDDSSNGSKRRRNKHHHRDDERYCNHSQHHGASFNNQNQWAENNVTWDAYNNNENTMTLKSSASISPAHNSWMGDCSPYQSTLQFYENNVGFDQQSMPGLVCRNPVQIDHNVVSVDQNGCGYNACGQMIGWMVTQPVFTNMSQMNFAREMHGGMQFTGMNGGMQQPDLQQQPSMVTLDHQNNAIVMNQCSNSNLQQAQMQSPVANANCNNNATNGNSTASFKVYLHNLPQDCQPFQIQSFLNMFKHSVQSIDIVKQNDIAIGVIVFASKSEAQGAAAFLHDTFLPNRTTPLQAVLSV